MISLIGKLTNGLIGWALPGLSAAKFYAVALVFVVGMSASWAYFKGSEGRAAAVARCESACTVKIANIQTAAERTILDIVTSVDEAGTGSKDVQQYCQKHPTLCRGEK